MTLSQVFFGAIDYIFDASQNKHDILYDNEHALEVTKNIRYSKKDKKCKLDIYRLPTKKPQPVLFYVHGGGFVAGGKHYRRGLATWFAKMGICVVNVDYGMSPKYNFKESMAMLAEALEWVSNNARKYKFDTKKVMLGGDSSGGYCALFLTNICTNPKVRKALGIKKPSITPTGLYTDSGIFDLGMMLKIPLLGLIAGLLSRDVMGAGRRAFHDHEDSELCSPINYVNKDYPANIFVAYAKKDIFCAGQSEKLLSLLDGFGVTYKEHHSTKLLDNHCYPLNWKGAAIEHNELLEKFIKDFIAK